MQTFAPCFNYGFQRRRSVAFWFAVIRIANCRFNRRNVRLLGKETPFQCFEDPGKQRLVCIFIFTSISIITFTLLTADCYALLVLITAADPIKSYPARDPDDCATSRDMPRAYFRPMTYIRSLPIPVYCSPRYNHQLVSSYGSIKPSWLYFSLLLYPSRASYGKFSAYIDNFKPQQPSMLTSSANQRENHRAWLNIV
jgi:hypothetical protein